MNTNTTNNEYTYWTLKALSGWLSGRAYPIIPLSGTGNRITIGRSKSCDIAFPGSQLSKQHVEVIVAEDGLQFKDLDSKHGLFINEKRTRQGIAKQGDKIRLDIFKFEIAAPSIKSIGEKSSQTLTQEQPVEKTPTAIEQQQEILSAVTPTADHDQASSEVKGEPQKAAASSTNLTTPNPLLNEEYVPKNTKNTSFIMAIIAIILVVISIWVYQYTRT